MGLKRLETLHHIAASACLFILCLVCALRTSAVFAATAFADWHFLQPQLETIGDIETIPEGVVTALAQDTRGFIWIGTQMGLVRFDGYQFRKYLHKANDPYSLSGNYVYSLMVGKDGRLWVGTNSDGIAVLDPGSERFTRLQHNARVASSLPGGRVWAMLADPSGGTWVASDHGLSYLPENSTVFRHYRHDARNPHSLLHDTVRCLLLDQQGRLLVASNGGLQALSANRQDFISIAAEAFLGKEVQSLFQAQDGKLWVGTALSGAAWLAPGTLTQHSTAHWLAVDANRQDALNNVAISNIIQVNREQIWMASYGGGINIVRASDGRVLQHLRHNPAVRHGLAHDVVMPLLLDRSGLLWIGTWAGGLQRFNPQNAMVRMLRPLPQSVQTDMQPTGLSHMNVLSILELANGQLLIGTAGNGIDIIDRQRGLLGGYRAGKQGMRGALPDATISALAQTADGSIWVGTRQAGIARLLPGSQVWESIPGLPSQHVRRILQSRDGTLWVATNAGIAYLPKALLSAAAPQAVFLTALDENRQPLRTRVYALAEDAQGRIWAGSDHGLWVLPARKTAQDRQIWQVIHKQPGQAMGLNSELASGLLLDSRAQLWVSTDQGLSRLLSWDGRQALFDHVTMRLNRHSAQIGPEMGENLMEDGAGRIWSEIAVVDVAKQQLDMLNRFDGIDLGISWSGAYYKTRDGLLLFGGAQGVAVVQPKLFQVWQYQPPLVLTGLKINGKNAPLGRLATHLPHALAQPSNTSAPTARHAELLLQPGQRDFSFEFAALDYTAPQKNRYQYRLEGYDKAWINADTAQRSATYGNLWPGVYSLTIRGSNRNGEWSPHSLQIPIRVLPAWWQTWWFGGLVLFMSAGLLVLLVQARTHYLRQRQRALEQQVQEAVREVEKSHHELAQSHQELEQSHDELAAALHSLQATQAKLLEAERHYISLEIHDNLSQTMTGILLQLDSAREALLEDNKTLAMLAGVPDGQGAQEERDTRVAQSGLSYVERAMELARDGIQETRQLLIQLRSKKAKPMALDLVDALRRELPRLTAGTAIQVLVEQQGQAQPLHATLELTFFRVAQEAVTNALRHGHAKIIHVLLDYQPSRVILMVQDNGCGFAPNSPKATPGIGLNGMRERVAALAGEFVIDSAPGKGCCITVSIPILKEPST